MNTTVFALLFCVLTAHCATYKTWDAALSRVVRSPHFPPPPPGDAPILFRTQNWSGVARGPGGAHGVFSGAAAAAEGSGPTPDEAFSLAAAGPAPVQGRLEERFGGPPFHHHHHGGHWDSRENHYSRGIGGSQISGGFAKSQAFSNAASGCDDESQNGVLDNQQSSLDASSNFQANSNGGGSDGRTQNGFVGGQSSSSAFSKSESSSFTSGQSQGGYSSGSYQGQKKNTASTGSLQNIAESKSSAQSESNNGGQQQVQFHGNGFGKSLGSQNVENLSGSDSNGFSSSQGIQNGGHQNQAQNNGFSSFQAQSSGSLGGSHKSGFSSSQAGQNGGNQQVESNGNGFGSSQDFQNGGGQQVQSHGYGSNKGQSGSYGFGQSSSSNYGSQGSRGHGSSGFNNGYAQSNFHSQGNLGASSSTGENGKQAYGNGFGSSKYQTEFQKQQVQGGDISGQSSGVDGSLTNAASQGNVQGGLSLGSGSSGHEDIQSTLSGALGLASQGLQEYQKAPCSTCQKSSYAFSNARSNSGSAVALSIGG